MSKPKLLISFSGGRTSAYMTYMLMRDYADQYDAVVVFANTGQEREETLEFVDRCDRELGFNTVWVEGRVQPKGTSTRHQVVDYRTANRDGHVFENVIAKYGIPNQDYPHCTRELKTNPITSYVRSIGWNKGGYITAIGIRADEIDRINSNAKALRFWYPLIAPGITKADIKNWWAKQSFDLNLKEHQGNCAWCWKKSLRKHLTLIHESPEIYNFPRRMEQQYADAGSGNANRVFFRGNRSTEDLFEFSQQPFDRYKEKTSDRQRSLLTDLDEPGGGCTEQCEAFGEDAA